MANKRVETFTIMAALISGHPVQISIAIHFYPCNSVLLPKNTCSILFCGMFFSIKVIRALGDIWQYDAEVRK